MNICKNNKAGTAAKVVLALCVCAVLTGCGSGSDNLKTAYEALGNCEAVQILVHPVEKRIVVMPIASKDPDAIRWIKDPLNPKSYKMECSMFTRKLFENWGLDEKMRYRTNGKVAL